MDLIKQFPDVSMKEREKFRLRQKLYSKKNSSSLPVYEKDKQLINDDYSISRNWMKIILTLLIVFAAVYMIILIVPEPF